MRFGVLIALLAVMVSLAGTVSAACINDPGSLIANGDFNGNVDGCWQEWDPDETATFYFGGEFYGEFAGAGSYDRVKLYQSGLEIIEGRKYELSFIVWADTPGTATFTVQRGSGGFESLGYWEDLVLPSTPTRIVRIFEATGSDVSAWYTHFLGNFAGHMWIQDVNLQDITCSGNTNLINPSFDCNPAFPVGWQLDGVPGIELSPSSDAYHGANSAKITGLPGGADYEARFSQRYIPITEPNGWYLLRFAAKIENHAGHHVTVTLTDDTTDESLGLWWTPAITDEWAYYGFQWRMADSTAVAKLSFRCGELGGNEELLIDAVQFEPLAIPDFNPNGIMKWGDFTEDGRDDCLYYDNRGSHNWWVAESLGDRLAPFVQWSGPFAPQGEVEVGDFDGDGFKDDVVVAVPNGPVIARFSDGSRFIDDGNNPWMTSFIQPGDKIRAGRLNADVRHDLARFTRGTAADTWVALNEGNRFGAQVFWHDYIAPGTRDIFLGDANGDGLDDAVEFSRGNEGYVFVMRNQNGSFGNRDEWRSQFAKGGNEVPGVIYANGDNRIDVINFCRWMPKIFVSLSDGSNYGSPQTWHGYFAPNADIPAVAAFDDVPGQDVVAMDPVTYRIYGATNWGGNFGGVIDLYTTGIFPEVPFLPEGPTSGVEWGEIADASLLNVQVWPNPVRNDATFSFVLPVSGTVDLTIVDASGRSIHRIQPDTRPAGRGEVTWDSSNAIPGVYFYQLRSGNRTQSGKIVRIR